MILALTVVVALVTVPLARGRLRAITGLHPRLPGLAVAGLALLVGVDTVLPGAHALHNVLLVASFWLLGGFAWANRGTRGLATIALGGALDFLLLGANGGSLPADVRQAHLAFLASPVDVGDVLVVTGIFVLVHAQCGSRLVPPRMRAVPAIAPRSMLALRRLGYVDDAGAPTASLLALRESSLDHLPRPVADAVRSAHADVIARAR